MLDNFGSSIYTYGIDTIMTVCHGLRSLLVIVVVVHMSDSFHIWNRACDLRRLVKIRIAPDRSFDGVPGCN